LPGARLAIAPFVRRARAEEGTDGTASGLGDEDAWKVSLGKVEPEEEGVGVDERPPRAAHAPAAGEGTRWETSKDVEENVIGETDRVVVAVSHVHRDGSAESRHDRPVLFRLILLNLGFLSFSPRNLFHVPVLHISAPSFRWRIAYDQMMKSDITILQQALTMDTRVLLPNRSAGLYSRFFFFYLRPAETHIQPIPSVFIKYLYVALEKKGHVTR
jgi:hypothetical protein